MDGLVAVCIGVALIALGNFILGSSPPSNQSFALNCAMSVLGGLLIGTGINKVEKVAKIDGVKAALAHFEKRAEANGEVVWVEKKSEGK